MRCADFLERYSDYCDGLIADPAVQAAIEGHLAGCSRCLRYHARIARGALLLRSAGEVEPSPDFRRRLRERLEAAAPPGGERWQPRVTGALVLAAVAALAWWNWTSRPPEAPTARPSAHVAPPFPAVLANPGVPFVSFTHLVAPAFHGSWRAPGATDTATFRAQLFIP